MTSEARKARSKKLRRWLHAAVVDAALWLLVQCAIFNLQFALCTPTFGQDCHLDPATGQLVCPSGPRPSTLDPRPSLAPSPAPHAAARVAAIDREVPAIAGATIYDFASGTLVYDDGQRAIVLTCAHNVRNTAPPYWVRLGQWRAARILAVDEPNDLAALEIAGGTGIAPAMLADGPPPMALTGCGFGDVAGGSRFACVTGTLSNVPFEHEGFRSFTGQVRQGDSGGPVFGPDGRLVGVLWGNHTEYGQVMFTCDQPLRRFLDRILPNRPGRIIPRAGSEERGELDSRSSILATPSPQPLPARIVPAPPARRENTPLVPVQPPAPSPQPPAIPPLGPTGGAPASSGGGPAPTWPATSWLDRLGRSGVVTALGYLGLSATGAGLVAVPAWLLVKWGARREAARIRQRFEATSEASSAAAGGTAAPAAEQTFRFAEHTTSHQPVARDASEGVQLLQLGQLEGRDPLLDAVAGRTLRARLEALAESHGDAAHRQWARDLIYELNAEFNKIAPAKTTLT